MQLVSQNTYRNRLMSELLERQRRNPAYSLRSFARDLQISPAALSQVLNAKRGLSKKNLLKVADRLAFTPSEHARALAEVNGPRVGDDQFNLVQDDVFRCISDWYYFAILSLADSGHAYSDPRWISDRFGISTLEARDAIERLLRLEMVKVRNGKLHRDDLPLRTASDVPSSALRALQKNHMRLAAESLEKDPIHLRDMTSITVACDPKQMPKAKEMIKTFRRKLSKHLEARGGSEVYVLAVQLFPVTKSKKDQL